MKRAGGRRCAASLDRQTAAPAADPPRGRRPFPLMAQQRKSGIASSRSRAASAAPSSRSASAACCAWRPHVVANTGDDFEHLDSRSRPTSTRCSTRSPASTIRRPAGAGAMRVGIHGRARSVRRRDLVPPRRRRSRNPCRAHAALRAARRCRRSPTISPNDFGIATRILPMSDDPVHTRVRRPRLARLPGLLCPPPVPAGNRRDRISRREHGAGPASGISCGAARSRFARRRDLSLQPAHQHRADPGAAGHPRRAASLCGAGRCGGAAHRRRSGERPDREDAARAR